MPVQSDKWIKKMAIDQKMIEPFEDKQIRGNSISYGVSSYGYDARVGNEFKIFTNVNTEIVDPFNNRKIRRMDVEEGDLIFFPSFFIHRAPPLLNDTQKTIVSFNFNVTKPIESSYKNFYHADYFTRIRKRLGWR